MTSTYSETRTIEMPYADIIKRELGYNKVLLFDEIPENWITYYRQKAVLLVFKYEVRHESKTYHVFSMYGDSKFCMFCSDGRFAEGYAKVIMNGVLCLRDPEYGDKCSIFIRPSKVDNHPKQILHFTEVF